MWKAKWTSSNLQTNKPFFMVSLIPFMFLWKNFMLLTPYPSVLDFWKIKFEKLSSTNCIFNLQKSISNLIFAVKINYRWIGWVADLVLDWHHWLPWTSFACLPINFCFVGPPILQSSCTRPFSNKPNINIWLVTSWVFFSMFKLV